MGQEMKTEERTGSSRRISQDSPFLPGTQLELNICCLYMDDNWSMNSFLMQPGKPKKTSLGYTGHIWSVQ